MLITSAQIISSRFGLESSAGFQAFWDYTLFTASGVPFTPGKFILFALVIFTAYVLSWMVGAALKRYERSRAKEGSRPALYALNRVIRYILIAIAAVIALELMGVPASKLAVIVGALSVGLGFGLQAIFSNFVSGIILLFDRSLKVGDFVELESGVHGTVRDINIRATRITTNDNIDILVPNSEFVSGRVVNWTHDETSRRLRIPFGVAYGCDKELVKKAALEAASAVPFTMLDQAGRQPQVWLVEFGDSSLNFELVVWLTADATKRPSTVRAAYTWELETALAKYNLEIPFPQRDLHVRSLFGLDKDAAFTALGLKAQVTESGVESKVPELSESERSELARNDAQADAEREADSDASAEAGPHDKPQS